MTQQVGISFGNGSPAAWTIAVIAELLVQPSVANPELWSVTWPTLASWSVTYAETMDGFATEADAIAAGLSIVEAQGWAPYNLAVSLEGAQAWLQENMSDFKGPAASSDSDPLSVKSSPAKRRKA